MQKYEGALIQIGSLSQQVQSQQKMLTHGNAQVNQLNQSLRHYKIATIIISIIAVISIGAAITVIILF